MPFDTFHKNKGMGLAQLAPTMNQQGATPTQPNIMENQFGFTKPKSPTAGLEGLMQLRNTMRQQPQTMMPQQQTQAPMRTNVQMDQLRNEIMRDPVLRERVRQEIIRKRALRQQQQQAMF